MFPAIELGPLSFPAPALTLFLATWLALFLTEKTAQKKGFEAAKLYNLSLIAMGTGIIGSRLVYIARYPGAFVENPGSLFSHNPGLLDLWGGLLFGVFSALGYGQRKDLKLFPTLDILTPGFAVLAIGLGISHLASGNAFGMPANLPWAIDLWGTRRHPSQIYESVISMIIFGFIWSQKNKAKKTAGSLFFEFVALTSGSRLFLEAFRGDSILVFGGIRVIQIVTWFLLAISLYFIFKLGKKKTDG
ncbi:MAG: prolipoprotein diacylglyceryl transferase [Anaerolineales bacterium]|nr:prolipoprotein diacylglyceryl transferase [Anaerolineales bacterium]